MDQEILFSTGECVLGIVLVARNERGVCAILLGDDGGELVRDLHQCFPQARLRGALGEIPAGSTETYAEMARRIGAPQCAKEVGEACAANVLAAAIPCHRVIRKDGSLGGYRWGVDRKRALLQREGAREAAPADLFESIRA